MSFIKNSSPSSCVPLRTLQLLSETFFSKLNSVWNICLIRLKWNILYINWLFRLHAKDCVSRLMNCVAFESVRLSRKCKNSQKIIIGHQDPLCFYCKPDIWLFMIFALFQFRSVHIPFTIVYIKTSFSWHVII